MLAPRAGGTLLGEPGAPQRTVFLVDDRGPTFSISFEIPLADQFSGGARAGLVYSQGELAALVEAGRGPDVLAAIAGFQPQTVVFSRYGGPLYDQILDWAKPRRVKTVFHIDDNLFDLPPDLPAAKRKAHLAPLVVGCREALARRADLVYCSTKPLEDFMRGRFPAARTFSGIYCPYPGVGRAKSLNSSKTLGFMGTISHIRDLKVVLPSLLRFLSEHPDWRFESIGDLAEIRWPPAVRRQVLATPAVRGYRRFREMLNTKDWVVGLAPLVKDEFNRCRSATKFVEYSAMGAVTVASRVEPYREALEAGAAVSCDELDADKLFRLLGDRVRLERVHTAAREFCERRYSTAVLARQLDLVLAPHGPS
ncbi:MAG: glycosyltransferase [Elusimicrobia bacterium]|nr:glycosyltransferase [Elusimicrobiota bacterium]